MKKTKMIIRNILLEPQDFQLVRKLQEEKGFGGKGFSAALRFILRDWASKNNNHPPTLFSDKN